MGIACITTFAAAIGRSRRSIYRLQKSGLTLWEADRLAVKTAGLHPFFVWGDAWLEAIGDEVEAGAAA